MWKRPPERAQRASLTSSVYSYLRWILTATSPTIYYSFYFTCSRDFIIGIMVLWYYDISIWIISIKHRPPERAQRASLTSSVHSYLRFILTATSSTIYYSFYFTCSRDFIIGIIGIMILWYYDIMILSVLWISIWIYKSLEHRMWKRPPERAQRASLTSSVHSYLRFIFTATSPTIFSSFYFTCSRDFIVGIMILWYYDIMVLWYYRYYDIISIKHRLWKRLPERAQRASLTSSVHSYLRFILTATSSTIYYSFYFTCSRDFIIGIIGIMD